MIRSMMQIYVKGSGETVELYLKAFHATLGFHVKNSDGSFYHSELDVDGHILAISEANDGMDKSTPGNTMQFCFHYGEGNEDAVKHAYETLKEGSEILFPLGPCDFSPLCTDFIDKFGVRWCLFV
ncbi:VOC family protein [Anaerocolumna xylanovorans]|uniref:PhnB protein n=1 Tax=Anaerocolumna xylanovorans DSM 12503 TaxID=1121345 RepID=A0A1M7XWG5_9FIRM|nr:VOC family protein [Anaerocolumna xylanovorans]SHO43088.1 PhnB protein [Anaerocolumna xylanovorans DSM 12503]